MKISNLWAPWRLEYIKSEKSGECPFCELPKIGVSQETLILYCDDKAFIILNKFPYNPGHLMVIPREHCDNPSKLSSDTWLHCSKLLALTLKQLEEALGPQGYNIGMNLGHVGGAGIPGHIHWHILPRWSGDTNFMPLLADTKAIPTHNLTTYAKLLPFFAGMTTI